MFFWNVSLAGSQTFSSEKRCKSKTKQKQFDRTRMTEGYGRFIIYLRVLRTSFSLLNCLPKNFCNCELLMWTHSATDGAWKQHMLLSFINGEGEWARYTPEQIWVGTTAAKPNPSYTDQMFKILMFTAWFMIKVKPCLMSFNLPFSVQASVLVGGQQLCKESVSHPPLSLCAQPSLTWLPC